MLFIEAPLQTQLWLQAQHLRRGPFGTENHQKPPTTHIKAKHFTISREVIKYCRYLLGNGYLKHYWERKMHQGLLPGPQQTTMCPLLVQCIYSVLKSLDFPLLFYSSLLNQQDLTL